MSNSPQDLAVTHRRNISWKCAECKMLFAKSKLLSAHARHTKHKSYRCSKNTTCEKAFSLRTAAIRHESTHSKQKNHTCSKCSKPFHRRDHCQEHETICSTRSPLTELRQNGQITKNTADDHTTSCIASEDGTSTHLHGPGTESALTKPWNTPPWIHSLDLGKGPQQQRDDIGAHLTRPAKDGVRHHTLDQTSPQSSYTSHDRQTQTWQCQYCPERFTRVMDLCEHHSHHTPDRRHFECHVCGQMFGRPEDRERHVDSHSGEETFVCRGTLQNLGTWGCGRWFPRADALSRHFKSETGRLCIKPLLDEESPAEPRTKEFIEAGIAVGLIIPSSQSIRPAEQRREQERIFSEQHSQSKI